MCQADFDKQKQILLDTSEEYLLKIENGEKENYIKTLMYYDDLKKYGKRISKNGDGTYCTLYDLQERAKSYLNQYKYRMTGQIVTHDNGAIGVSHICSIAKPLDKIIYLSGSGADEIISDYGFNGVKHYGHSTIGGRFPHDLKDVFPWKNFFGNTQRAYLMKEETVTGTWGIEGRYPFLDKQVVQEFLWLTPDLKNKNYKSPIYNYLTIYQYPFENGIKVGFNCGFSGQNMNHQKRKDNQITMDKTPVGKNPKDNRTDLIVNLEEVKKINDYMKKNKIVLDL